MLSNWSSGGEKATLDVSAVDYTPKRFCKLASSKLVSLYLTPKERVRKVAMSLKKQSFNLVVIGTSTGGPIALQQVLSQLPANFPYPLLLIQHMPAKFTPSFSERLNSQCKIRIKHAENGDLLSAGTAYLAPGGTQMLIRGNSSQRYLKIQAGQEAQLYKPCIDTTLESLTNQSAKEILTVILTGMGSDGLKGCQKLKQLGATIWAQNKQSSIIYGMPKAIVEAGIADKVLDIFDIGHHLAELK